MLRRSMAWQARRDQRAQYRADFDEARVHGLRIRHVMKQVRLDTDESLRELGLMPVARAATAPATPPTNRPPAETRPSTRAAATPTARPPVDRAAVDRPTSPAAVAGPANLNPDDRRAVPPQSSSIAPATPKGTTSRRPASTTSDGPSSTTTAAAPCATSTGFALAASCPTSVAAASRARSVRSALAASRPASVVAPSSAVGRTVSHGTSSIAGVAVPAGAPGAGEVVGSVGGAQWARASPNVDAITSSGRRSSRLRGRLPAPET
jgi:hypothetical protein